MAATAETLEIGRFYAKTELPFVIGLVEVPYSPEANTAEGKFCINADMVPWLTGIRDEARDIARQVVEARREKLREGEFDDVPLDVDAVGTAAKVARVKEEFGADSPECADARGGLLMDCERKFEEAFSKNEGAYFSPTNQQYDPVSDMLYANGLSVDEMHHNGLSPLGDQEMVDHRINDSVNLATLKEMVRRPEARGLGVMQFMPCPDWAMRSFMDNPKGAHGGYVPEIKKIMIGFDWFDHDSGIVFHDQVGAKGEYFTPEVISETCAALGIIKPGQNLNKTEIHGTQGIVSTEHIQSALGALKVLDAIASEKSGLNIFRGEVVDDNHPKNYEQIIEESKKRQQEVKTLARELACYIEELEEKGTDHALGTVLVEKFIQEKLLDVTEENPDLAEVVFDKDTANKFRQAMEHKAQGNYQLADQLIQDARINAPAASSCGAGSCGLEELKGGELTEAKRLLDLQKGETIAKNTWAQCPNCGEKSVVIAYTTTTLKKACTNKECGAKDFNGAKTMAPQPRKPLQMTFFSKRQNKAVVLGGQAA